MSFRDTLLIIFHFTTQSHVPALEIVKHQKAV